MRNHFKKPINLVLAFTLVLLSNCNAYNLTDYLENPGKLQSCGTNCRIFLTNNSYNGNFGGVKGADNSCTTDSANPAATTRAWKAVLSSPPARNACITPDCGGGIIENFDWALRANTQYKSTAGALISTTTSSAIFTFPFVNVLGAASTFAWTGLAVNWTPGSACNGWTVADTSLGATGDAGTVGSTAIFSTNGQCLSGFRLYCAEQ